MGNDLNKESVILITGGNGLVGSALTNYLRKQDFTCVMPVGREEIDLTDQAETIKFFKEIKPDYVFHLAATVYGIAGNMKNHGISFFQNSMINLNVIEASRQANVKKIVAMGTCAAYPDDPLNIPLTEEAFCLGEPHDSEYGYAQAKRAMLANLVAYNKNYDMRYAYVISTNLYGPNDTFDTKNGHVIPSLIKKFYDVKHHEKKVIVWGDGSAKRDFLYSEDAAMALFHILKNIDGPINMASGTTHLIKDVVDILTDELSIKPELVKWDASKPNGRKLIPMDTSKLQTTNFKPRFTLKEGLLKAFYWYEKSNLKDVVV